MIIESIEITNIKGIEYFYYDAGMFNDITGDNETGKTSFLDAMQWALRGENKHFPKMLRTGTDMGSVKIMLSGGHPLISTVTKEKSTLEAPGHKSAAKFINDIREIFAINPTAFIYSDKKARLKTLLETLPLDLDYELLSNTIGIKIAESNEPLELIEYWEKKVYEDRTATNKLHDRQKAAAEEFQRNLPHEEPDVLALEEEINELVRKESRIKDDSNGEAQFALSVRNASQANAIAHRDNLIEIARKEYEESIAQASEKYETTMSGLRADHNKKINPVVATLAAKREELKTASATKAQIALVDKMRLEVEELKAESLEATQRLKGIETIKKTLLRSIPIKGVSVSGGEIYLENSEGVPTEFDSCSESQQMSFCLQLAKIRSAEKELSIIRMDKLEAFGVKRFENFKEYAIKSGIQHWISRVTADEELSITAYN